MSDIKVVRNDAGNCVNFVGTSNPAYWNACLSARVNSEDNTRIDVVNDIRSVTEGGTVYEFFAVPYTDFSDAAGNSFATAQEAADYITAKANVATNTGSFIMSATDTLDFSTDATNTTILLDNGDSFAVNSIQATAADDGSISIVKQNTSISLFSNLQVSNTYIDGVLVTQNQTDAVNELNALFTQSGSATAAAPVFTSVAAYNITAGDSVNILVNATGGVGYEYSGLPDGLAINSHNRRNIVGSVASTGTYTFTVTAVNFYGSTTQTITLNVASGFANTKSVSFSNGQFLGANAALMDGTLGRTNNGSGSSDAWTVSQWIKPASLSSGQTFLYFGSADTTNGGYIEARMTNSGKVRFSYGSGNNYIRLTTASAVFTTGVWTHVAITYDGGTTGASSADVNLYYNRFSIYVNGVLASVVNSHSNYGWSGGISGQNFRVGKFASGNTIQNGGLVEELAIWSSDQGANMAAIYNGGNPFDLDTLSASPDHWWRMGDGDTYSVIQDTAGGNHFVMYNMTAGNIVTDAP